MKAIQCAAFLISHACENNKLISNLQLQKMLFSLKSITCESMIGTSYSMTKFMLGSTAQSFRMFTMPILDMVVAPS